MENEAHIDRKEDMICPLCQSPYTPLQNKVIRTTKDVLSCVRHFGDKKQEYFICLSLDSGQRLIAKRIVTIGLLDQTMAHPREVFAGPVTDRAASVIIVHNHPSGDASPSKADIEATQQLAAAGIILGIELRDHVIVASIKHFSFHGHGLVIDSRNA
jgi:DNA repair protein RadC